MVEKKEDLEVLNTIVVTAFLERKLRQISEIQKELDILKQQCQDENVTCDIF